jgi:hypothetical protein
MYVDRGEELGGADDLPGDDTKRFYEYWNHVFMAFELWQAQGVAEENRPPPRSEKLLAGGAAVIRALGGEPLGAGRGSGPRRRRRGRTQSFAR